MQVIELARVMPESEAKELKNSKVTTKTVDSSLPLDFIAVDSVTKVPFAMYTNASIDETDAQRRAYHAYRKYFTGVMRSAGMKSLSSTFGFNAPAHQMQRIAPSASTWARQHPESHSTICNFAAGLSDILMERGPQHAIDGNEAAKNSIHEDWRLGDTCYTSGIVNDTANLLYHYDRNNTPGTWSAMIVARAGTRGGHLHIADYDLTLPCKDGDLLYFPGMELMHGVTPITSSLKDGYRFSAVYYSVNKFVGVPSAKESLRKATKRQSENDDGLIERQKEIGLIK